MREEYSKELIKSGIRGKYAEKILGGANVVFIEPDLCQHFPDSESVNRALRDYLDMIR